MQSNQKFIELLREQFNEIHTYFLKNIHEATYEELSAVPAWGGWSVLQVLDHLNFYNRWYLPRIDDALQRHRLSSSDSAFFSSGWLGAYFTKMMKPSPEGTISSKMKAPKNAIPASVLNPELVISQFSSHLSHLLYLLENATYADAFLIAHMERHFCQIESIQKAVSHKYVVPRLEKAV